MPMIYLKQLLQSVGKKLSSAPHSEVWMLRGWISARGRNQVQPTLLIDSSQPVNRIGTPIILPAFRPAGPYTST